MKLLKMSLENFQGIRKAEFDFVGRSADIYGDNGTGKTTVFNAFTWLIFGNSSMGAKDYTPKTKTHDGDAHNLDHAVECVIEIDGEEVTFRRAYREVWKKVRGNAEAELSGHTTDYYIDGVPKQQKEYARYWENIFENEEIPKLLSMPFYFAETLHWEKRRSILLDICGIVSDSAIMESDIELRQLLPLLGNRSADEYRKVLRASLTEINRSIQSIPARIDEAEKAIPSIIGYTPDEVDKKLIDLREKISEAEKDRAAILANDTSVSSVRAKIAELNYELTETKRRYSERVQAESAESFEIVRGLREKLSSAQIDLNKFELSRKNAAAEVIVIEKKRAEIFASHRRLQDEQADERATVFDETATVCFACGQALPPEKAEEIREAWNQRKSERLTAFSRQMEELVERGRTEASKEMLATAEQALSLVDK